MNITEALKSAVFAKAGPAIGWPEYGLDCDGRMIARSQYGIRTTYGWEIDHILPVALGGTDDPWNLRPRHWLGNARAGGLLGGLFGR